MSPAPAVLLAVRDCDSEAEAISLAVEEVPAEQFVQLLSAVSGVTIESGAGVTGRVVTARLEAVPWDCVLEELARKLDVERSVERGVVLLSKANGS